MHVQINPSYKSYEHQRAVKEKQKAIHCAGTVNFDRADIPFQDFNATRYIQKRYGSIERSRYA